MVLLGMPKFGAGEGSAAHHGCSACATWDLGSACTWVMLLCLTRDLKPCQGSDHGLRPSLQPPVHLLLHPCAWAVPPHPTPPLSVLGAPSSPVSLLSGPLARAYLPLPPSLLEEAAGCGTPTVGQVPLPWPGWAWGGSGLLHLLATSDLEAGPLMCRACVFGGTPDTDGRDVLVDPPGAPSSVFSCGPDVSKSWHLLGSLGTGVPPSPHPEL